MLLQCRLAGGKFTTLRREELAMAREGTFILDSGDKLPALAFDTVAHGRVDLPDGFGDDWGVFLIYRAHW
jgi:hypothetical protein